MEGVKWRRSDPEKDASTAVAQVHCARQIDRRVAHQRVSEAEGAAGLEAMQGPPEGPL